MFAAEKAAGLTSAGHSGPVSGGAGLIPPGIRRLNEVASARFPRIREVAANLRSIAHLSSRGAEPFCLDLRSVEFKFDEECGDAFDEV